MKNNEIFMNLINLIPSILDYDNSMTFCQQQLIHWKLSFCLFFIIHDY